MPVCFKCGVAVDGINNIQRHFRFAHQFDKYTPMLKCVENGCFVTYSSWQLLRRHYKYFHHFLLCENADASVNIEPRLSAECSTTASYFEENSGPDNADNVEQFQTPDNNSLKDQLKDYASKYIAKLYAKPGQPRCIVQEHVNDSTEFLSSALATVDEIIKEKLCNSNVDPAIAKEISDTLSVLKNPFHGFTSEYFRFKYLKEKGYYIEPIEFDIDSTLVTKRVDKKLKLQVDTVNGVFIPFRKVLKAFLELPNVFDIVCAALESEPPVGIVGEFIHGSHWQTKKRHFQGKTVIPLNLYHDDYEVDKDLGPHSAKLGAVYFRIACLPSEFQGAVENIFLALLFNAADRSDFGNKRVFRKLIQELNFLQHTGIEIVIKGYTTRVFFAIGVLSADNAAMHLMLGFAEGFTCNYPCRFCRVHKNVMHYQCEEDPTLLRDRVQHQLDCSEANVTNTGVNGPSVLEEIDLFHPTENPSVDLMHDVFEGVCLYDLRHVLYHLIFVQKYFDTDVLNFRIISFDYSSSVSNKPVQLKENAIKEKSWKMTANEMRTFVRTLALLVGDLVPTDEPVWEFYHILRDIIELLLCSVMQVEALSILSRKISEHHYQYNLLFFDTLKPKHHNMLHYSSIIKLSGVPSNYACDRFEANHQPSIRDAKATTSRRNIAYTLAVKEQLRVAQRLLLRKGLTAGFEVGPEAVHVITDSGILPRDFHNDDVSQPKFAFYKGTKYQKDTCVVVGIDCDGGPLFGLVNHILINSIGNVCLVCKLAKVISYSSHYHSFCVDVTNNTFKAVKTTDLFDYHPVLYCTGFDSKKYVSLHHTL